MEVGSQTPVPLKNWLSYLFIFKVLHNSLPGNTYLNFLNNLLFILVYTINRIVLSIIN
jgi:hypothetical protein